MDRLWTGMPLATNLGVDSMDRIALKFKFDKTGLKYHSKTQNKNTDNYLCVYKVRLSTIIILSL